MNELRENKQIWQWMDRDGNLHDPREMETRHLFYTLRMIWNHAMPENVRLYPYKRYTFGGFCTDEYMQEAVRHIGQELLLRLDIKPAWDHELQAMARNFSPA